MPRCTRADFAAPTGLGPRAAGARPRVNATALVAAYEDAVGVLEFDAKEWVLFCQWRGHTPVYSPAFVARVLELRAPSAGPVLLAARRGPDLGGLERELLAKELEGLGADGALAELTPEQWADPAEALAEIPLQAVITGPRRLSPAAAMALASGELGVIALAAADLAAAIVAEVAERLGAEPGRAAHGGAVLASVEAATRDPDRVKVRVVASAQALNRGVEALGIPPGRFTKDGPGLGFLYLADTALSAGMGAAVLVGKADLQKFFYTVPYAPAARRWLCVREPWPGGKLWRYEMQCMGAPSSPVICQSVTSVTTLIARVRGAVLASGDTALLNLMDDFILLGEDDSPETEARLWTILEALLALAGLREQASKRERFAVRMVVLGRLYDLKARSVALPAEKVLDYLVHAGVALGLATHGNALVRAVANFKFYERPWATSAGGRTPRAAGSARWRRCTRPWPARATGPARRRLPPRRPPPWRRCSGGCSGRRRAR